jgi:hypothetical protein
MMSQVVFQRYCLLAFNVGEEKGVGHLIYCRLFFLAASLFIGCTLSGNACNKKEHVETRCGAADRSVIAKDFLFRSGESLLPWQLCQNCVK